jgi:hypothetical protein
MRLNLWIVFFYLLIACCFITGFLDIQTLDWLTKEDGIVETAGALFLFVASIGCLFLFVRSKNVGNRFGPLSTHRNVFFLALAILFFIGFGEEISWGQRIFGLQTPALFLSNTQNEMTIHNLSWWEYSYLNPKRLYNAFCLGYCVAIPLLHRYSKRVRTFLHKMNMPVAPIWVGGLLVLSYAIVHSLLWSGAIQSIARSKDIWEVHETTTEFAFFLLAVGWVLGWIGITPPVHNSTANSLSAK